MQVTVNREFVSTINDAVGHLESYEIGLRNDKSIEEAIAKGGHVADIVREQQENLFQTIAILRDFKDRTQAKLDNR
jgi:hypothetical protein